LLKFEGVLFLFWLLLFFPLLLALLYVPTGSFCISFYVLRLRVFVLVFLFWCFLLGLFRLFLLSAAADSDPFHLFMSPIWMVTPTVEVFAWLADQPSFAVPPMLLCQPRTSFFLRCGSFPKFPSSRCSRNRSSFFLLSFFFIRSYGGWHLSISYTDFCSLTFSLFSETPRPFRHASLCHALRAWLVPPFKTVARCSVLCILPLS